MPRLRRKTYTPQKARERRAEQAVRAIKSGRSVLSNEVRICRHVETLEEGERKRWLNDRLGDVHESTVAVLQMANEVDMDAECTAAEAEAAP